MSKDELKPLKLDTPERFKSFLDVLWDELYWANFYYETFQEANRLCAENEEAVKFSPIFWTFTLRAHCQTALVYLHRIYDQNRASFNLRRFLLTVEEHKAIFDPTQVRKRRADDPHADSLIKAIGTLDLGQLTRDIEFSTSKTNPKVENLNRWRNRVTFHKDERELSRTKPFEQDYPLPFSDIDELLEHGFQILNRYSEYFDTTRRSNGCREWKDMRFVFEALVHHPKLIRSRDG